MVAHSFSAWQAFGIAVFVVVHALSITDTSELEKLLGQTVLQALEHARLTVKEACALMRVDEGHFRKGLRADEGSHISLTRLVRLPFTFWLAFTPSLIYLVAKTHVHEIAEDLGLRKER